VNAILICSSRSQIWELGYIYCRFTPYVRVTILSCILTTRYKQYSILSAAEMESLSKWVFTAVIRTPWSKSHILVFHVRLSFEPANNTWECRVFQVYLDQHGLVSRGQRSHEVHWSVRLDKHNTRLLTMKPVSSLWCNTHRLLRRIQRHEVTSNWRNLDNKKLHSWYTPANILRMIKSIRLRWAGHVSHAEETRYVHK